MSGWYSSAPYAPLAHHNVKNVAPYLSVVLHAAPNGGDLPAAVRRWCDGRTWWSGSPERIIYDNTDSGCCFSIRLSGFPDTEPDNLALVAGPDQVVARLRTLQPPVYPDEVGEELAGLVRALGLRMSLPDDPDPTPGPWSLSRVLLAWRTTHRRVLNDWLANPDRLRVGRLPAARIKQVWEWNRRLRETDASEDEDVHVARVSYADLGAGILTWASWPNAIPILLPQVDFILAGEGFVVGEPISNVRTTWVPWSSLSTIVARYPLQPGFPWVHRLVYDQAPSDLVAALASGLLVRQVPWEVKFAYVLAAEDRADPS